MIDIGNGNFFWELHYIMQCIVNVYVCIFILYVHDYVYV